MRWKGCWAVAIGLLVATDALALELRPLANLELPPEVQQAFKRLFQDVDKELGELARKDRAAAQRLADLEAGLRLSRSRVARLESQVMTLKLTIERLERAIARTAKTQPPTPQPPTKPGGPGSSPKTASPDTRAKAARIVSRSTQVDGNFLTVSGVVQNVSDRPLTYPRVVATFVGSGGKVIKTDSCYTSPQVVQPGARASFKIVTRLDARIRRTPPKLSVVLKGH